MNKKGLKTAEKNVSTNSHSILLCISTSFWVRAAPKSWSKAGRNTKQLDLTEQNDTQVYYKSSTPLGDTQE